MDSSGRHLKSSRKLESFYTIPYSEDDVRIHDENAAEKTLKHYEQDEHIRWVVAEITARQMFTKRVRGDHVTDGYIKQRAYGNWRNYKQREERLQSLETSGQHYGVINIKPMNPLAVSLPEIRAIVREQIEKSLSLNQQKILIMLIEGKDYSEIAKKLGRTEHAIQSDLSRIKKKIYKSLYEE